MNKDIFPLFPVLVVDDEEQILHGISGNLRFDCINNIITCQDSRRVMEILFKQEIEVLLLDLSMPYITGQELLPEIRKEFPELPVIIITGVTEVEIAVECMEMGIFYYLVKVIERSKLLATVKRAIEIRELRRENSSLKEHFFSNDLEYPEAFSEIVTNNMKMRSVFLYVESIAKTNKSVLIAGETGVGKELIARSIHALSERKGKYIPVNIAGFDDNIFSDTLFGHEKGAYTGATHSRKGLIDEASEGTLFLDEIGDLSPTSQVKLLRLLDAHEYYPLGSDVPKRSWARIIVATNKELEVEVEIGKFRKDLLYRLRTHKVHVPVLSERMDDLPLLINYFLEEASRELEKKKPTLPPELYTLLRTYHFPGNIRELKSMVFDAVSKHKTGILSLESFKEVIGRKNKQIPKSPLECSIIFPQRIPTLKEVTRLLIKESLKRANGNQSIAAQLLGISQPALSKRLMRESSGRDEYYNISIH